jgi:hypothetical protein
MGAGHLGGEPTTDTKVVWGLGRGRCVVCPPAQSHNSGTARSQCVGWLCGMAREDSTSGSGSQVADGFGRQRRVA